MGGGERSPTKTQVGWSGTPMLYNMWDTVTEKRPITCLPALPHHLRQVSGKIWKFKGSRRSTNYAAQATVENAA
jgi:hypothetical protein